MDILTIIFIISIIIIIITIIIYYFFYIKPDGTKTLKKLEDSETDIETIINFVNKLSESLETEQRIRKSLETQFNAIENWKKRMESETEDGSLGFKIKKLNNVIFGVKKSDGKYSEPGLLWRLGMIFGTIDSNAVSDATDTYIFPDITGLTGKVVRIFKKDYNIDTYVNSMETHYDTLKIPTENFKQVTFASSNFNTPNAVYVT